MQMQTKKTHQLLLSSLPRKKTSALTYQSKNIHFISRNGNGSALPLVFAFERCCVEKSLLYSSCTCDIICVCYTYKVERQRSILNDKKCLWISPSMATSLSSMMTPLARSGHRFSPYTIVHTHLICHCWSYKYEKRCHIFPRHNICWLDYLRSVGRVSFHLDITYIFLSNSSLAILAYPQNSIHAVGFSISVFFFVQSR